MKWMSMRRCSDWFSSDEKNKEDITMKEIYDNIRKVTQSFQAHDGLAKSHPLS
jgi:hypothetical protein